MLRQTVVFSGASIQSSLVWTIVCAKLSPEFFPFSQVWSTSIMANPGPLLFPHIPRICKMTDGSAHPIWITIWSWVQCRPRPRVIGQHITGNLPVANYSAWSSLLQGPVDVWKWFAQVLFPLWWSSWDPQAWFITQWTLDVSFWVLK